MHGSSRTRPTERRPAAARRRALALALALLASCARGDPEQEQTLRLLERLAFVPSGQVHVGAFLPIVLYECPEPLLVDMFEVTRGEWARFVAEEPEAVAPTLRALVRGWPAATADWPATSMTQPEARAFAAWRGMRLPDDGEWLYCALGRERRRFPWGVYERQDSVANTLELALERPCAVGTFEGGRTPNGLYDMLGNVAEWVEGDVFERGLGAPPERRSPADPERSVSALGGSFRTWSRPIYRPLRAGESAERAWLALSLHPRSRLDHVGLRCVVPAAELLARLPAALADGARRRERLEGIGRRWGRTAAPLLRELLQRAGGSAPLAALLSGAER